MERKVNVYGCVHVQGKELYVDSLLYGETVRIKGNHAVTEWGKKIKLKSAEHLAVCLADYPFE